MKRDEALSLSKGDPVPATYLPSEPGRSIGKSLQEHKAEMASGGRAQVFICGGLWAGVLLGVVMQLARRQSV